MVDVFGEVDEQLRSDRIAGLARKYLPWAVGVAVILLVAAFGAWGFVSYRDHVAAEASTAYSQGLDSLSKGDKAGAAAKFAIVAKSGSAVYRCLGLMQEAGLHLDAGDQAGAVALFDQAAQAAPNQDLGDAARLKSALALLDTASLTDLETRLQPLTDVKRPLRTLAREALAMAKLRAGRIAEARADFNLLKIDPDASQGLAERAGAAVTLIDEGSASAIAPTVKAAVALPPAAAQPAAPVASGAAQ